MTASNDERYGPGNWPKQTCHLMDTSHAVYCGRTLAYRPFPGKPTQAIFPLFATVMLDSVDCSDCLYRWVGEHPEHEYAAKALAMAIAVSPKPCPFCGLWPTVRQAETGRWVAMCSWSNRPREERKGARHHVDFFAETRAEAIDAWNARP